jgi:hypothetical protein
VIAVAIVRMVEAPGTNQRPPAPKRSTAAISCNALNRGETPHHP